VYDGSVATHQAGILELAGSYPSKFCQVFPLCLSGPSWTFLLLRIQSPSVVSEGYQHNYCGILKLLTLWRPEKNSSPINLKFLPHPDNGKWSLSPFEVDFFRATVREIQYWGFLTNWDILATFLFVKNHQFGIICNFRKSFKNRQNNPKI
jgi:hypothetical protein